jgi:hypothetical protein
VSKLGRAGLALVAVTVLVPLAGMSVAGASVAAKQKPVSEAKYAKVLCGTYNKALTNIDDFTAAYNAAPTDDPAAFQAAVAVATTDYLANVGQLKAKLAKVYPDVDGGKRIAKIMATDLGTIESKMSDALAKFQAADPNGVAFTADITQFEVALRLLGVDSADLSKVTDQDVIGAIDDEKSCKEIFPVVGG